MRRHNHRDAEVGADGAAVLTTTGAEPATPLPAAGSSPNSRDLNGKDVIRENEEPIEASDNTELPDEIDPFSPFPDDAGMPVESHSQILTVRAVLTGCALGALVNASNIYLGLRTGFTFGANLFGAIIGFVFLKFCSKTFGEKFPILGGSFGPKENAIVQTAATAAGGLGGIFVSAIPALYQLKLLDDPVRDFPRLLTFTIVSAYYGLFFSTPLRKFFIIHVARELKLIFPSATATAMTIKSMHSIAGDVSESMKKRTRALTICFVFCLLYKVGAAYAPGILWDWHIFTWFFIWSGYKNRAILVENFGWYFELTPAFIGSGMLVGLNPAISFFAGTLTAWGIVAPLLVRYKIAFGTPMFHEGAPGYERWHNMISYVSMKMVHPKTHPSPRYWLLWPGVLIMICASFAELAVQYKLIWYAFKSVWKSGCSTLNTMLAKTGRNSAYLEKQANTKAETSVQDPASKEDQVPTWMWSSGLVIIIIATCIVLGLQYQLQVGTSLLAIFLGFLFAFLAIQCTGVTDTTPLTTAAKATQLILGAVTSGQNLPIEVAQRMNLIGGAVASGAASQSTDLTVDFRVGFLLKTPPRLQWYAQAAGSVVAMFMAPGMFILFTKAYPCILDVNAETCPFGAPSVSAWRAVAIAVTDPTLPIPPSSGIFAIVLSCVSVALVLVRHYLLCGEREKYRIWLPNAMSFALGFVIPSAQYAMAMLFGAIISHVWQKMRPLSYETYCYALAAGMLAGEGMGGVAIAVITIAGAGPSTYGSPVACPGDTVC